MSVENMSEEDLEASLDKRKLPQHVAITMDGNGRWATRRNLPRTAGHRASIDAVRDSVELCGELEIRVLTLYTFSSENWKRPIREVNALMKLLIEQLKEQTSELNKSNVQLRFMGQIDRLPKRVIREIERSREETKDNTGLILNLALNYGGRQEIVHAIRSIVADVNKGEIKANNIDAEVFARYLYTSDLPDPYLLIRTGSMMRISNFFLWQLSYTEI